MKGLKDFFQTYGEPDTVLSVNPVCARGDDPIMTLRKDDPSLPVYLCSRTFTSGDLKDPDCVKRWANGCDCYVQAIYNQAPRQDTFGRILDLLWFGRVKPDNGRGVSCNPFIGPNQPRFVMGEPGYMEVGV